MINSFGVGLVLKVLKLLQVAREKAHFILRRSLYWTGITSLGLLTAGIILLVSGVSIGTPVHAGGPEWVAIVFGNIFYYLIIGPMGLASVLMGYILQTVITYPYGALWSTVSVTTDGASIVASSGGFVNVSAVQVGWKLVRDVCNVFFSLILIVIALANVLKIEAYSWKTLMPKFVLMAILINFSKTICGVATDLGTVAMATFGGSFANSFATGVLGAFGLPTLADFATGDSTDPTVGTSGFSSVMLGYILAAIMTMVFFVVLLTYTVVLIFRIIMLWFLIVMSPLAYITRILPQTKKYSSQWWEMFGRYVTVGPLITFFLWLSLTMSFGSTVGASANPLSSGIGTGISGSGVGLEAPASGFQATSPNVMANFLIALMMLMASMQLVSKMASEAGKITGAVEKFAWDSGKSLMKLPGYAMRSLGTSGLSARFKKDDGQGNMVDTGLSKFLSGAGSLSTFAGSTVFDPGTFKDKAVEGFQSWRKKKSESVENRVGEAQKGMFDKGGVLNTVGGYILGHRTSAEHMFENYTSPDGIIRAGWNALNSKKKTKEAKDNETKADTAQTAFESNKTFNRFEVGEEEQARQMLAEYQALDAGLSTLGTTVTDLKAATTLPAAATVNLDTKNAEVQAFIASSTAQLEAQKEAALNAGLPKEATAIDAKLAALKAATSGPAVNYRDLVESATYDADPAAQTSRQRSAMAALTKAFSDKEAKLKGEQAKREAKLMNSSGLSPADLLAANAQTIDFVALGNLLTPGTLDYNTRASAIAGIEKLRNDAAEARAQVAARRPTEDFAHRAHTAHAVQDAMKKIADATDTTELMNYLDQAIVKKDNYMAEAVIKKITDGGDLDALTTRYLRRQGISGGTSDAKGLELFRKKILAEKMGMTDHNSYRVANDASLVAGFGKKQTAFALAYKFDDHGHMTSMLNDPKDAADRVKWIAAEYKKKSIRDLNNAGSAQWGYKEYNQKGELAFKISEEGEQLLEAFQVDLANPHYFQSWSADARTALSQPEVIAALRAKGRVNEALLGQLEQYRKTTQQGAGVRFAA